MFTIEIGFMVYLGMTASRFLKEYEDEHREELERQQRLLFKQNKSEMRNSIKEYVRATGSDYQVRPSPGPSPSNENNLNPLNGSGKRNDFSVF